MIDTWGWTPLFGRSACSTDLHTEVSRASALTLSDLVVRLPNGLCYRGPLLCTVQSWAAKCVGPFFECDARALDLVDHGPIAGTVIRGNSSETILDILIIEPRSFKHSVLRIYALLKAWRIWRCCCPVLLRCPSHFEAKLACDRL